mgnify:CR=1 FL=1
MLSRQLDCHIHTSVLTSHDDLKGERSVWIDVVVIVHAFKTFYERQHKTIQFSDPFSATRLSFTYERGQKSEQPADCCYSISAALMIECINLST